MSDVLRRHINTGLRLRARTSHAVRPSAAALSSTIIAQPSACQSTPPLPLSRSLHRLSSSTKLEAARPTPPLSSPPPTLSPTPLTTSPSVHLLSALPMSVFSSVPLWLYCVAAYVSLSVLLLYFPSLLASLYPRRREVRYSVRYGAHRGGGGERIENTIAAFDHAVSCGCTLLELDVHLTKDGRVVVLHDSTLQRTTGRPMRVNDTNFADLPRSLPTMAAPPPFSPPGTLTSYVLSGDPSSAAAEEEAYGIPLLSSVLERFPHSVVNVDLKDDSDQLCDACIQVIEQANAHDRIIWGSMHSRLAGRMRVKRPDWHMFCSPREVLLLYLKFFTGLLPFLPIGGGQYVEIPYLSRQLRPVIVSQLSARIGERAAELVVEWVVWLGWRRALFQHLNRRGHPVVLWVINEPSEMRDALDIVGAAGIMTDYPERMQRTFSLQSATTQQSH